MLIGRRNYLRIVHAGFVCRNGGFHVLFRAVGTDFPRQSRRLIRGFKAEGGEKGKNGEERKREGKRERERGKKWQKVTRNNERYRSANMAVARRLGKSLLFNLSPNWL